MNIKKVVKRPVPSQSVAGCQQTVKYVLTEGAIGDFAVYEGIGTDEYVASQGNKLMFSEALQHFPFLTEDKYRR